MFILFWFASVVDGLFLQGSYKPRIENLEKRPHFYQLKWNRESVFQIAGKYVKSK